MYILPQLKIKLKSKKKKVIYLDDYAIMSCS